MTPDEIQELHAAQLIDDAPYIWTWTITGPLQTENRWQCHIEGVRAGNDTTVTGCAPTRAESIIIAHRLAMNEQVPA